MWVPAAWQASMGFSQLGKQANDVCVFDAAAQQRQL
jgi:hypothetical protein